MKKTRVRGRWPRLLRKLRPTFAEVDYYARLILRHEQRPLSALSDCRREAEIQLWIVRSLAPDAA
ncbi:MAG: hypothetical protein WDM96_17785 [Lacunisphaera sp.]